VPPCSSILSHIAVYCPALTVIKKILQFSISYCRDEAELKRQLQNVRQMKKMYRRRHSKCRVDLTEWLETGVDAVKTYVYPSFFRQWKLIADEWPLVTRGLLGCIVSGLVIPMIALCLGQLFLTFQLKGAALYSAGTFWTGILILIAVVAGVSFFFRILSINSAGELFTLKLRMEAYESILRQPISWFDSEIHSPARLYTRLASDVPNVKTVR